MANTNFIVASTGKDITDGLIEKSYVLDRYPELYDTFKQSGLWLWGSNNTGQLGRGNTSISAVTSPAQTVGGGNNWKLVSTGTNHCGGIKTDGTLWMWGDNSSNYGQLGDGTSASRSSPVKIGVLTDWKQIACGSLHTAAIKTDGTLWVWGYGFEGRLGMNSTTSYSSPVQVGSLTDWKQVVCGDRSTYAIKTDGTIWSWGYNFNGELGDSTTVNKSSPVQVGTGAKFLSTTEETKSGIIVVKTNGTLWAWGPNTFGQLGLGDTVQRSSPTQIGSSTDWKQVQASATSLAIKTNGTLWAWGGNSTGQLGLSDATHRSTPTAVGTNTNWKQLSGGAYDVGVTAPGLSVAIKTDGTLWWWGLGDGFTTSRSSPTQFGSSTNWKSVNSSYSITAAIRDSSEDLL